MTPDAPLDPLARAIAEGEAVDWDSAESAAPDNATRGLVRELAVIAAIADVHSTTTFVDDHPAIAAVSTIAPDTPTWGPFRLLERVGQGAYGEVYRALDTRLDREVALKLLRANVTTNPESTATSSIREGSLLARVHHPNVVTIHGAERIGDRIGLWMEFVKGRTLEQILEDRTTLTEVEVVGIGIQVCRAVAAVHGAGLLHRDIKAQNVMRAVDGRIVLMDFGAGRMLAGGRGPDLAGTPLYLAPEVLGGKPATVQSDLYSVGVLLYRLAAGAFPVHGRTVSEVRACHERGERTRLQQVRPDVSPQLVRLIERAIHPNPGERFASADALVAELTLRQRGAKARRVAWTAALLSVVAAGMAGWGAVAGDRTGSTSSGPPSEGPPQGTHAIAALQTDDWQARGRAMLARRGLPSAQQAAELYERAIASNPRSAAAHAGLAYAHAFMSFPDRGISFDSAYPIMRQAATTALQLDPQLPEAHAAIGWVYAFERNWPAATQAFDEAIRLDPTIVVNYTTYSIAVLQPLRRFDEALRLLDVAAGYDPQSLDVQREIGEVLLYAGRFGEAVDTLQRVRTANPDFAFVQTYLARSLIVAGRPQEALRLWQQDSIWPAQAYVQTGRRREAEALAVEHAAHPHRMALISAALGDTAGVIEAVERAAKTAPHRMGRLLNEPELMSFRDHARIVALRQEFGLP